MAPYLNSSVPTSSTLGLRLSRAVRLSHTCSQSLKSNTGFSLVEVLVVITLAGILSSLALVSYQDRADRELLNRASKLLQTWLDDRRTQAMASMETTGTGACVIAVEAGSARLNASEVNPTIELAGSPANVTNLCQLVKPLDLRNLEDRPSAINLITTPSPLQQVIFTFRGTSPTDAEFKLIKPNHSTAACVKVIKPLGLVRLGRASPATNPCDYQKPYTAFTNS